ncbi:hypothetical protein ACPPVO_45840 [Dactylosporangium sp. McL0621]|uniref:hypothetical protein n=1 Tax=Dactylosporangium sp. McL0621 TaxID=3415678 RepID=UPI003CF085A2
MPRGDTDICVIDVDGTDLTDLTGTAGVAEHTPVWSPDGATTDEVPDWRPV